jgi:hypothetical protein
MRSARGDTAAMLATLGRDGRLVRRQLFRAVVRMLEQVCYRDLPSLPGPPGLARR